MDGDSGSKENDSIDWNTEDELELDSMSFSSCEGPIVPGQEVIASSGESSSSNGSSISKVISHFLEMGFAEQMVVKAMKENGENNSDAILEALLTYSALENISQGGHASNNPYSFESESNFLDDLSDMDSSPENEENTNQSLGNDTPLSLLLEMGYEAEEALTAIERCGEDTPIVELLEFLGAAQMAKEADFYLEEVCREEGLRCYSHQKVRDNKLPKDKKRKFDRDEKWENGGQNRRLERKQTDQDEGILHLPNPMIGFGVPSEPLQIVQRTLPEEAVGPPFFYFENVALTPKGVWRKISRFLYEVEPEFVDSKFFCATNRKRGYIHNLPIHNRFPLLPIPAATIHEALPITKKWWPSWDTRTKLNCLLTCVGSAKLTERIRKALENSEKEPPPNVKKFVLEQCKKWNLVWVGRNKVAPLEPDEMELLLGFPRNHTRGGGINRTDRYKCLGNSFQVDTVGYHLSVLKNVFPDGINVLSLFSGIGGAEVALHRLGIPLKNVVSIEKSETCRNILHSWWEQTKQEGNIIHISDVKEVNGEMLEQWISSFGGFDLVIGGSPCNNFAGGNRVSRDGLEGEHSALFYDYFRILDQLKSKMRSRR